MIPSYTNIFIAAIIASISSSLVSIFASPFESTMTGFSLGILFLLWGGSFPKIPRRVKNEVRS